MGLAVFLSFKIPVLITIIYASSAQKFGILLVGLLNYSAVKAIHSNQTPKNSVEDTRPGKHTNIAIEHGYFNSEFSHEKWWIFP